MDEVRAGRLLPPPTIHEFRAAAECMRDLVDAYRCLTVRHRRTATWQVGMVGCQRNLLELEDFVTETLSLGLANYSPRVVWRKDLPVDSPEAWAEHFRASADLWSVCCLELFNHIAERAIYKTCANERRRRPFVRQIGRARHGQRRRSGVLYCSNACAQAQAQRAYQRRKRHSS